jgi:hypothetical protein
MIGPEEERIADAGPGLELSPEGGEAESGGPAVGLVHQGDVRQERLTVLRGEPWGEGDSQPTV